MKEIHNLMLTVDAYVDKSKIEGSFIVSFDTTITP
jgi:hypothetical protein